MNEIIELWYYDYEIEVKLISEALKIYLKEDIEKKLKLWKKTIKNLIYNHFIIFILLLYYKYLNKFI